MTYTHPDPTSERYMPPIVMDPTTGADYDTLLTLLDGWSVTVHHHDGSVAPITGMVNHGPSDNYIHLYDNVDETVLVGSVDLDLVRWIQVL